MRLSEYLIKRLALDEGRNLIKKVDCFHFLDVFYTDTSIFSPWPREIKNYSVLCFLSFVTEGYFSEKNKLCRSSNRELKGTPALDSAHILCKLKHMCQIKFIIARKNSHATSPSTVEGSTFRNWYIISVLSKHFLLL
jgi:hypothetical protein